MVPMARILVVGVVFIAALCAFAELKPTRQPISASAAAETNFMLSPFCVSLRRPGEPVGRDTTSSRQNIGAGDHQGGALARRLVGKHEALAEYECVEQHGPRLRVLAA